MGVKGRARQQSVSMMEINNCTRREQARALAGVLSLPLSRTHPRTHAQREMSSTVGVVGGCCTCGSCLFAAASPEEGELLLSL
jgi:hypothetical protein